MKKSENIKLIVGESPYPNESKRFLPSDYEIIYPFTIAAFFLKSWDDEDDTFKMILNLLWSEKDKLNARQKTMPEVFQQIKSEDYYFCNIFSDVEKSCLNKDEIENFLNINKNNSIDVLLIGNKAIRHFLLFKNCNLYATIHPSARGHNEKKVESAWEEFTVKDDDFLYSNSEELLKIFRINN